MVAMGRSSLIVTLDIRLRLYVVLLSSNIYNEVFHMILLFIMCSLHCTFTKLNTTITGNSAMQMPDP